MANMEKPKEEDFFAAAEKEIARKEVKPTEEFFPAEKPKSITEEDVWGKSEIAKKKETEKAEVQKRLDQLNKELEDVFSGKGEESEVASANEIEEARRRLEKEAA